MMEMMQIWAKILEPVLIHFIAINIVQMMGLHADAAFLTTMAAVMVLPFFCYKFRCISHTNFTTEFWIFLYLF